MTAAIISFFSIYDKFFLGFSFAVLGCLYLFTRNKGVSLFSFSSSKTTMVFVVLILIITLARVELFLIYKGTSSDFILSFGHAFIFLGVFFATQSEKSALLFLNKRTKIFMGMAVLFHTIYIIYEYLNNPGETHRLTSPSAVQGVSDSHVYSVQIALLGIIFMALFEKRGLLLKYVFPLYIMCTLSLIGSRSGMLLYFVTWLTFISSSLTTQRLSINLIFRNYGLFLFLVVVSLLVINFESRSFSFDVNSDSQRLKWIFWSVNQFNSIGDVLFGTIAAFYEGKKFVDMMFFNILLSGGLTYAIVYLYISYRIYSLGTVVFITWLLFMILSEFLLLPRVLILFLLLLFIYREKKYVAG